MNELTRRVAETVGYSWPESRIGTDLQDLVARSARRSTSAVRALAALAFPLPPPWGRSSLRSHPPLPRAITEAGARRPLLPPTTRGGGARVGADWEQQGASNCAELPSTADNRTQLHPRSGSSMQSRRSEAVSTVR